MSKIVAIFTDGSCLNAGGIATKGPSGWSALFMMGEKVVKELGGTYRSSTSGNMEKVAFREAAKKIPEILKVGIEKVVIWTDYKSTIHSLQSLQTGKLTGQYAEKEYSKELQKLLEDLGFDFKAGTRELNSVISACGRVEVKWVKAHQVKTLEEAAVASYEVRWNFASDKKAIGWAQKSLI